MAAPTETGVGFPSDVPDDANLLSPVQGTSPKPASMALAGAAADARVTTPKQRGKQKAAQREDDDATQVTAQEGRWRAGVNRQAQPSAALHQQHAGAMRQAQPGASLHQAVAGAARQAQPDATLQRTSASQAAAVARTLKRKEREQQEQQDALAFGLSEDEDGPDPEDLDRQCFESSGPAWDLECAEKAHAWSMLQASKKEREQADRAAGSELIWLQDSEDGSWSLRTRANIAGAYDFICNTQPFLGNAEEAAAYFRDRDSEETEERAVQWLEKQLACEGAPPPPPPPSSADCYYEGINDVDSGVFPAYHPREGQPVRRPREEWLSMLSPGERAHHESRTPRVHRDKSGRVVLIEELDPEGDFPFSYFPEDINHGLAGRFGSRNGFYAWLEAGAAAPPLTAMVSASSQSAPQPWSDPPPQPIPDPPPHPIPDPPKRSDFPSGRGAVGKAGRMAFHHARQKWYRMVTRSTDHPEGLELEGSLGEQNTKYDIIARRFRMYSDRHRSVTNEQSLPPAPQVQAQKRHAPFQIPVQTQVPLRQGLDIAAASTTASLFTGEWVLFRKMLSTPEVAAYHQIMLSTINEAKQRLQYLRDEHDKLSPLKLGPESGWAWTFFGEDSSSESAHLIQEIQRFGIEEMHLDKELRRR